MKERTMFRLTLYALYYTFWQAIGLPPEVSQLLWWAVRVELFIVFFEVFESDISEKEPKICKNIVLSLCMAVIVGRLLHFIFWGLGKGFYNLVEFLYERNIL